MLWEDNYLAHYGVKGQRWGIRRYQNEDGTLTEEGLRRYGSLENFNRQRGIVSMQKQKTPWYVITEGRSPQRHFPGTKIHLPEKDEYRNRFGRGGKMISDLDNVLRNKKSGLSDKDKKELKDYRDKQAEKYSDPEYEVKRRQKVKKVLAITAGVTVAAIAGYMAYKAGHKWTGNLQRELRSKALVEGTNQAHNRELLRISKYGEMQKVNSANNMLKDARRLGDSSLYKRAGAYRRDAFKAAKSYSQSQANAGKISDYYMNMSKNATRMDAVKNYLKNHRKIVLPGYPS